MKKGNLVEYMQNSGSRKAKLRSDDRSFFILFMNRSYYVLLVAAILGCNQTEKTSESIKIPQAGPVIARKNIDTSERKIANRSIAVIDIKQSRGVLVAEVGDNVSRALVLYNKSLEPSMKIAFAGQYEQNMKHINPLAKNIETFLGQLPPAQQLSLPR